MIKLTVYFEDPFWAGIFEKTENNLLSVSRIVFGSEPKDSEIYQFILSDFQNLVFGKEISLDKNAASKKANPKRIHRKIRAELKKKKSLPRLRWLLLWTEKQEKMTAKQIKS